MSELPELYFHRDVDWYDWLLQNSEVSSGVYLIFYKIESKIPSMRWEEAVKVALCFGWIDSTVKNLGGAKRRQYFCRRNTNSVWSALNKKYIIELEAANLIHKSGYKAIEIAKENGSWTALDAVNKGIIPKDLQQAFDKNKMAYTNYKNFAPGYRKSYLYWLNQAKREATRLKRIGEIIKHCEKNIKSRGNY